MILLTRCALVEADYSQYRLGATLNYMYMPEKKASQFLLSGWDCKILGIDQASGLVYAIAVTLFLGIKVLNHHFSCYTVCTSYEITYHSCDLHPIHKNQLTWLLEVISLNITSFNYVATSAFLIALQPAELKLLPILQLPTYCGMHCISVLINTLHYTHNAQLHIR